MIYMREKMKKIPFKQIIICLILAAAFVYVIVNRGVFYKEIKNKVGKGKYTSEIDLLGNKEIRQRFVAAKGSLVSVSIRFSNMAPSQSSGVVHVQISNKEGEVLGNTSLPSTLVWQNQYTEFIFPEEIPMEKGERYFLTISSENVQNAQGFGVLLAKRKGDVFKGLFVGDTKHKYRVQASFLHRYYSWFNFIGLLFLFLLVMAFTWIPWKKCNDLLKEKKGIDIDLNILMSRILFFSSPLIAFILMERFNGFDLAGFFHKFFTWKGILNSLIYGVIWWGLYLIINRTRFTSALMVILPCIFGLGNYFVWEFRNCPIVASDIQSFGTAMNVAQNYVYELNMDAVIAIGCCISFALAALSLKGYKGLHWKKRLVFAAGFVAVFSLAYYIFFGSTFVKDRGIKHDVWKPELRYAKNGSALSFIVSWSYLRVEKPDGYSPERVEKIIKGYKSDKADGTEENLPNVIAIMNEAFADLNYDTELATEEDFMPYIHNLTEDTVKGKLHMSIRGANTANSEFEFLTGDTMAFFAYRSIPYNTYIKNVTPSLTRTLKAQGYAGLKAVHPYLASGWNREAVYEHLGFSDFLSDIDFIDPTYIRNFISDESSFEKLISEYEETRKRTDAPFYVFNVTMQNHGGYAGNRGFVPDTIEITDWNLKDPEAEQYITLIKESDTAFKNLVKYFKKVDEPTVIVMFGDHQPSIHDDFYRAMFGRKLSQLSVEENDRMYQVPFVIWANYDIEEKETEMSANYLSSYLLKLIGAKMTGYNKYLLDLQEKLPIITAECYMGDDGVMREPDEQSEYSELINEYRTLQYNSLFDVPNRADEFFFLDAENK